MACVDVIVTSFHPVVTQSIFGKALFECEQLDGDPIVFIRWRPIRGLCSPGSGSVSNHVRPR
jgi:hypothetical protein